MRADAARRKPPPLNRFSMMLFCSRTFAPSTIFTPSLVPSLVIWKFKILTSVAPLTETTVFIFWSGVPGGVVLRIIALSVAGPPGWPFSLRLFLFASIEMLSSHSPLTKMVVNGPALGLLMALWIVEKTNAPIFTLHAASPIEGRNHGNDAMAIEMARNDILVCFMASPPSLGVKQSKWEVGKHQAGR